MLRLKRGVRTTVAALLAAVLLAACGGGQAQGLGTQSTPPAAESGAPPGEAPLAPAGEEPRLRMLRGNFSMFSVGRDGFFMSQYPQGDIQQNLMYYDFKAGEERYFCDLPGCTHDHEGCVSYDLGGGFAFAHGDHLYVNYSAWPDGSDSEDRNEWPSALVRYDPDGTNPEVLLTAPPYEMQIQTLLADEEALYFSQPSGFVRLDLSTLEMTVVAPYGEYQEYTEGYYVNILGSLYNNQPLFLRQYYEDREETILADEYELFSLNVQTGQETHLRTFQNGEACPLWFTPEGRGYFPDKETGAIHCLDLATGQVSLVTEEYCHLANSREWEVYDENDDLVMETHYAASMWDVQPFGDWLIVKVYQHEGEEYATSTWAYNLQTEESREVSFGNFFNGGLHHMYIWGQTDYGLLVIEEYRPRSIPSTGTGGEPYVLDTYQEVYGLIDLEDFVSSNPNFRTLAPVAYTGMA